VVDPVDEIPQLTEEDELGLLAALDAVRRGEVFTVEEARRKFETRELGEGRRLRPSGRRPGEPGPEQKFRSGELVRSWPVSRLRVYYQRTADTLIVLRVYHQARRPL
jgi:hypothetical protein